MNDRQLRDICNGVIDDRFAADSEWNAKVVRCGFDTWVFNPKHRVEYTPIMQTTKKTWGWIESILTGVLIGGMIAIGMLVYK